MTLSAPTIRTFTRSSNSMAPGTSSAKVMASLRPSATERSKIGWEAKRKFGAQSALNWKSAYIRYLQIPQTGVLYQHKRIRVSGLLNSLAICILVIK